MINRRFDRRTFIKKAAADNAVAAGRTRLEMRVVPLDKTATAARLKEQDTQMRAQEIHQPQDR